MKKKIEHKRIKQYIYKVAWDVNYDDNPNVRMLDCYNEIGERAIVRYVIPENFKWTRRKFSQKPNTSLKEKNWLYNIFKELLNSGWEGKY